MKILIVLDNPKRDLDSVCLVAAELKKHHDVAISFMSNLKFAIFHYNPDHVILNYLRVSNEKVAQLLLDLKIEYSVLDTEGGLFARLSNGETSFTKTLVKNDLITKHLKYYFCWGENIFNYLKEVQVYPTEGVLLTGTPRTDIYYYLRNTQKNLVGKRPYVLVNTSFPLINPKYSTPEKEIEMLVSKFNYTNEYINERVSFVKKVQSDYIALTIFLAEKFPELDFIFRPHPFENEAYYYSYFSKYSNIKVICEGTVANWINESILLIHFECSTAIEAALLGKVSLSLSKYKDVFPLIETYPYTIFCDSFDDIASAILKEKACESVLSRDLDFADIYYKVDGKAYSRIAKAFLDKKVTLNRPPLSPMKKGFFIVYTYFKNLIKKYVIDAKKPSKEILPSELESAFKIARDMTGSSITFRAIWKRLYWVVEN
ncbi:hypothetical protein DOM21_17635 [Bacteriovorax stolpii]|uniref:surface carbohydrate biosynthesis protein n=1 Tax=Bacteriovorax stolpii TaxID=960 RepID=UPI00115B263A|nr:surface carbohydrate biosynthesis protein [Bacteriovorax stolpii]QDK43245.1 hypothetical protein DOM21_17635 [Bacteriovorax stolpii]